MRDVAATELERPALTRSVVACLASILELDAGAVPAPPADHPEPWTVWRNWLGERGLGLIPVLEPASFGWPGPWLALLRAGGEQVAAVAFGVPPGLVWTPLGGEFDDVELGYVIAPADVALWTRPGDAGARTSGTVAALALAGEAEAPMISVESAPVRAGRGLEGDRYFDGHGTFSNVHARGVDLTLIEAEALEALGLPWAEARRNIVTRGIDLNALVGRRFFVGDVECHGRRLCEPCAHLQRLTRPGVLRALVHRGGLRADVLGDGVISAGDSVRVA